MIKNIGLHVVFGIAISWFWNFEMLRTNMVRDIRFKKGLIVTKHAKIMPFSNCSGIKLAFWNFFNSHILVYFSWRCWKKEKMEFENAIRFNRFHANQTEWFKIIMACNCARTVYQESLTKAIETDMILLIKQDYRNRHNIIDQSRLYKQVQSYWTSSTHRELGAMSCSH